MRRFRFPPFRRRRNILVLVLFGAIEPSLSLAELVGYGVGGWGVFGATVYNLRRRASNEI